MNITISNDTLNNTLQDIVDAMVLLRMNEIISDDTEYRMEEDKVYYEELKRAAHIIRNHYKEPSERYEL